jgi:hypothetical protein
MSDRSNIKGAPEALTPNLVADFVRWLDRELPPRVVMPDNAISRQPLIDAANRRGVEVILPNPMRPTGRAREERHG